MSGSFAALTVGRGGPQGGGFGRVPIRGLSLALGGEPVEGGLVQDLVSAFEDRHAGVAVRFAEVIMISSSFISSRSTAKLSYYSSILPTKLDLNFI